MYKVIWDPARVPSIYSRKGGTAIPAPASAPVPVVHRCIVASSASNCLLSPWTRPPQLRHGSAAKLAHRAAQRNQLTVGGRESGHALAADGAVLSRRRKNECTGNVTAVLYSYSADCGLAIGGLRRFAISHSAIGRGKCLGVQLLERRAEATGAWRVRLAAVWQL
ncbi:hypothetical protein V496_04251 [Pseudogymnoascus sp. VKM F-4515 (FW-2607)]|nr:hypothetical protein V496_04251 [Pseudogymnoascus sp. VKM F-4515 (FW-2607)]